jgi:hypothetical protein
MKNGKRPTRKQKDLIKENGLDPQMWLIAKHTSDELLLVHRYVNQSKLMFI